MSLAADKTTYRLYEPFRVNITLEVSNNFSSPIKIDAYGNTVYGMQLIKIFSLKPLYSGENLPCPQCVNTISSQIKYSKNTIKIANDRLTWNISNLKNSNLRSLEENSTVNRITYVIINNLISKLLYKS